MVVRYWEFSCAGPPGEVDETFIDLDGGGGIREVHTHNGYSQTGLGRWAVDRGISRIFGHTISRREHQKHRRIKW